MTSNDLLCFLPFSKLLEKNRPKYSTMAEDTPAFQARANDADSRLDSLSALDIDSKPPFHRQTGIVCTIGLLLTPNDWFAI